MHAMGLFELKFCKVYQGSAILLLESPCPSVRSLLRHFFTPSNTHHRDMVVDMNVYKMADMEDDMVADMVAETVT